VYIHWPYCKKRCSYCNFNKYVVDRVDHDRMISCLVREWRTCSQRLNVDSVDTIFFGGGTPSLMRPDDIQHIVRNINDADKSIEISLECNPADVMDSLGPIWQAGINRVSLGIQSLDDRTLELYNRDHSAAQARQSLEACLRYFQPSQVSVDLIFGAPGHTVQSWLADLEFIIQSGIHHVSTYQLTVERGTRLHKQVSNGELVLPSEEEMADMYTEGVKLLQHHGLHRYEISNFARAGAESVHNSAYWSGNQYIGLGPGSHSRVNFGLKRESRINVPVPEGWMTSVEQSGHGIRTSKLLDITDTLGELLVTGLRRRCGISCEDWNKLSDGSLSFAQFITTLHRVHTSKENRSYYCLSGTVEGSGDLQGLVWTTERIWLNSSGLNVADHILPVVFCALQTSVSQNVVREPANIKVI